jgi:lactate dehydrogenase-like 2-hydroxyacid dehydrogenase
MPAETALLTLTPMPADLRGALEAQGYSLHAIADQPAGPLPGWRIALGSAMAGCDAATFDRLPDLGLLASMGTGLERIDLIHARKRGIAVANTPDVLTEDTADFGIALLYGIARQVVWADRFVRDGRWAKERPAPSTRLFGKRCGVFGLGRIGAAVARRAQGIGMQVAWSGPQPKDAPWPYVPTLAALAEQSDVLILCCPGGAATRGIVNADILKRLGPAGFLINIARGEVVDEEALMAALKDGTIRGAGTDVFHSEPVPDPRMLDVPNLVVAPHYASITFETRQDIIGMILGAITGFRNGTPFHDATKS